MDRELFLIPMGNGNWCIYATDFLSENLLFCCVVNVKKPLTINRLRHVQVSTLLWCPNATNILVRFPQNIVPVYKLNIFNEKINTLHWVSRLWNYPLLCVKVNLRVAKALLTINCSDICWSTSPKDGSGERCDRYSKKRNTIGPIFEEKDMVE